MYLYFQFSPTLKYKSRALHCNLSIKYNYIFQLGYSNQSNECPLIKARTYFFPYYTYIITLAFQMYLYFQYSPTLKYRSHARNRKFHSNL